MIVSVEWLTNVLVVSKLLFTVLKAFRISADTLSANQAVSTRYIMLIIFCLGSRGSDMTYNSFIGFTNVISKITRIQICYVNPYPVSYWLRYLAFALSMLP